MKLTQLNVTPKSSSTERAVSAARGLAVRSDTRAGRDSGSYRGGNIWGNTNEPYTM